MKLNYMWHQNVNAAVALGRLCDKQLVAISEILRLFFCFKCTSI